MKVIFLDHDGVMCLSAQWGGRFKKKGWNNPDLCKKDPSIQFDNFDPKAVRILNQIIEETGAEIVVSSDWRNWTTVEQMGMVYEKYGIVKKPIDQTPKETIVDEDFHFDKDLDLEQGRSWEIKNWLKDHPEVTHWVAIDDLDMTEKFGPISGNYISGLKNFVLTPRGREGIKQSGIKEKILKFLI